MARDTFRSVVLPLLQEDPLPAINWLKQHRLLRSEANCGSFDSAMSWTKHAKCKDGYTWRCQTKGCVKYKYTTTIRTGSFFFFFANFVDPQSGAHTQTIESYWNKHKSHLKTMRGCRRDFLSAGVYVARQIFCQCF